MQFTWDERKNLINQQKHGISFETAVLMFDDIHQISTPERTVDGETRWQTIGMVNGINILLVAHTVSESGDEEGNEEIIRIISARKATPRERRVYAKEGI
ncbi:MAG: BrnT family toxin [Candidatus Korobacteraceae bacterium]